MKTLNMNYFAFFRDMAGKSNEAYSTEASTPAELYQELKLKYDFNLCPSKLKVAINDEFKSFETQLMDGDKIVFIPPVAGG